MFFTIVGVIVVACFALALGWLMQHIAGNIYGGIRGAYRLRRLRTEEEGEPPFGHWKAIRFGLHCWVGRRYRDGIGEYWTMGDMEVPLDGRDPIRRSNY